MSLMMTMLAVAALLFLSGGALAVVIDAIDGTGGGGHRE